MRFGLFVSNVSVTVMYIVKLQCDTIKTRFYFILNCETILTKYNFMLKCDIM